MIYLEEWACLLLFYLENKYMRTKVEPIVLIHGFLGFDAETIINFPYWGGTVDLVQSLREEGFSVFSAQLGPVSSNRDRACELYAFLMGGRVDYGAAHAHKFGHARFGRSYPGIFSAGQSATRRKDVAKGGLAGRVHLIGHSMGGQTARLLVELLENGDPEELDFPQTSLSPLFEGGHYDVESITTLSTPHDGTTLGYRFRDIGVLRKLFARLLVMASLRREDPFLDLMIDHWRPAAEPGESLEGFVKRAIHDNAWQRSEDFCYHDLIPAGASALNRRVAVSGRVYYFSWANSCTRSSKQGGHHVPQRSMNLPLHLNARYMGSLEEVSEECGSGPEQWWENDGMVNTCSMDGPTLGSSDKIISFQRERGVPDRGVWNYMGKLDPLDHWQMHMVPPLGGEAPPGYETLTEFYRRWCEFLYSLPE